LRIKLDKFQNINHLYKDMTIATSIADTVKRQVANLPEGKAFFITLAEGQSEMAYFKALSRMVLAGKLIRIEKGKYYKPQNTRFGVLRPSETEIIKTLTKRGNKTVGYITGNSLYNQWGLTTQVPGVLTIARRSRLPKKELSGYKVKFVVRAFPFKADDVPMLQLLDALTDIRKIPDASPATVIPILADKICSLPPKQQRRMVALAMEYPPATRALLGALLEAYFPTQPTDRLRDSLNPLTKYRLKKMPAVLPNSSKWNFL
jgi:hypothetical protein